MTHATGFSYAIYANLTGGWTNITSDVISGTVRGLDGMESNRHLDRVGQIGEFSFELRNNNGYYSPGHASVLPGWDSGVEMRLVMTYDGIDYTIYGRIAPAPEGIILDAGSKMPRAKVTVTDFFDLASTYPIVNPGIQTNKTGAEILNLALASMPLQPLDTEFDDTVNTFAYAFDTITSKTKVYGELSKIVFSEVGYGYIRPDGTFVLEAATRRSGLDTETPIPVVSLMSGRGLREDGGYELREDGGYELRDETEVLNAAGTQLNVLNDGFDIDFGVNLLNRISGYAYPRKLDASPVVLFRLSQPLAISPGQTITIKGTYADPAGGLPVNGQNMITPAATTDYLFNTQADGLGTNRTVDIVLVSTPYGTEGFTHQIRNGGSFFGYLIQYNTRGYGIYVYNPIEHTAQSAASIAARSVKSDTLHQKYQQSPDYGALFTDAWVEQEKHADTRINKIRFCANFSPTAMNAALNIRVGSLIRLQETRTAKDNYFYIQGREWELLEGKILMMSWITKEMLNLVLGLSLIGLNINNPVGSNADAISYGVLPWLQNEPAKSVVITIYPTDAAKTLQTLAVIGSPDDGGAYYFSLDTNDIWFFREYSGVNGEWHTDTTPIANNTWYRVAVSFDDNTGVPTIYINGVKQTLITDSSPTGTVTPDASSQLAFGAVISSAGTYSQYFKGKLLNPLIYNRALTDAEMATLTAGALAETIITNGLVFQGFAVPTKHLSDYMGTLTSGDKLWENIYGMVGTPIFTPEGITPIISGRAAPSVVSVSTTTGANVTSTTHAHTVAAGDNRLLLVLIAKRAYNDITSVTFNGDALTLYDSQRYAADNYPEYEIWYKVAPDVVTGNVVVTLPSADWVEITAINLSNVDQTVPFCDYAHTTGTSANPALSTLAPLSTIVIDILSIEKGGGTTLTVVAGQTQRSNLSADTNWAGATSSKPATGAVLSTGWTISTSPKNWVYGALSILGAE